MAHPGYEPGDCGDAPRADRQAGGCTCAMCGAEGQIYAATVGQLLCMICYCWVAGPGIAARRAYLNRHPEIKRRLNWKPPGMRFRGVA